MEEKELQSFLDRSKKSLAEVPTVNPNIEADLMQRFALQHATTSNTGTIAKIINYPIPSWLAFAACLLVGIGLFYYPHDIPTEIVERNVNPSPPS